MRGFYEMKPILILSEDEVWEDDEEENEREWCD